MEIWTWFVRRLMYSVSSVSGRVRGIFKILSYHPKSCAFLERADMKSTSCVLTQSNELIERGAIDLS